MRYLLPCECGRKVPVAATQAGETVVCECGRSHVAPKLRELRQLESHQEAETAPRRAGWSTRQGVLFVVGALLLIVAGLALGWTAFLRQGLVTEKPEIDPAWIENYVSELDEKSPVEMLEVWEHEILEHGLERMGDPAYLVHRQIDAILVRRLIIWGVVGAVGLGLILAAFFLRSPPSEAHAKTRPRQ